MHKMKRVGLLISCWWGMALPAFTSLDIDREEECPCTLQSDVIRAATTLRQEQYLTELIEFTKRKTEIKKQTGENREKIFQDLRKILSCYETNARIYTDMPLNLLNKIVDFLTIKSPTLRQTLDLIDEITDAHQKIINTHQRIQPPLSFFD
jgi:hypothetical protein